MILNWVDCVLYISSFTHLACIYGNCFFIYIIITWYGDQGDFFVFNMISYDFFVFLTWFLTFFYGGGYSLLSLFEWSGDVVIGMKYIKLSNWIEAYSLHLILVQFNSVKFSLIVINSIQFNSNYHFY